MHSSKVAFLSVNSNSLVVILKIIVGLFTGSVPILSEAIHSFLDLLASLIAFFSIRISNKPADKEYPMDMVRLNIFQGQLKHF